MTKSFKLASHQSRKSASMGDRSSSHLAVEMIDLSTNVEKKRVSTQKVDWVD
jgi:hypothetical protein